MFDAMDQGMVSGVIASIGTDWELTALQKSFLGSSGVLGMIVGAAIAGILADRFGRRTIVLCTLLIFSLGSFACGFALSYEMLLFFRFITGIGLGGELPVITSMVSEFSPIKSRGRNVVIVESFWAWGWIIASLVAYLCIPLYGWRIAFFIGAVPALFAAALRFAIPESPRYLVSRGRLSEADKIVRTMEAQAGITSAENLDGAIEKEKLPTNKRGTFKRLWSKDYRRSTIVLWVLWFGVNFGYYGFVLWTPSLLVAQGYDLVKSFEFTLIMCFAQLPGYATAAYLIEKIGRKPVLTIFLLGTALSAWFFGQSQDITQILVAGCFLYFFALGAWGCIYSYTPEQYPTDIRASGAGWAAAFGRVGAFLAPMVVPVLYGMFGAENGFTFVFTLLTGVFVAVALVIGVLGKETKGQAIEELE
jgi:putative MFS transporter